MALIETIKDVEKETEVLIEGAKKDAEEEIEKAKANSLAKTESLNSKFKEDKVAQLATQKESLKSMYRDILKEGNERAENIKSRANKNMDKAVKTLIESLSEMS
ncbi:MAG: hypothetical protein COV70_03665 [Parcubacteria group bacterium CG11_big_fil_rev_8_21_14_0_20_39_22]|nr:MAG: hypothetical protein COV70_03665 [Parcubacteria group bacterium CG11_big_fil_rev_8_21_14_0_20_39_22]